MTDRPDEFGRMQAEAPPLPRRGFFDTLVDWNIAFCEFLVLAMMLVIAMDVATRLVFDYSWQMSEEIAGYLLVALVFCSLAGGMRERTFLRVDFLYVRLSERRQKMLDGLYGLLGLVFVAVWTWQLGRLVWSSYTREMVSNSVIPVPLWIPQLAMPIGGALLTVVMLRMSWTWVTRRSAP